MNISEQSKLSAVRMAISFTFDAGMSTFRQDIRQRGGSKTKD